MGAKKKIKIEILAAIIGGLFTIIASIITIFPNKLTKNDKEIDISYARLFGGDSVPNLVNLCNDIEGDMLFVDSSVMFYTNHEKFMDKWPYNNANVFNWGATMDLCNEDVGDNYDRLYDIIMKNVKNRKCTEPVMQYFTGSYALKEIVVEGYLQKMYEIIRDECDINMLDAYHNEEFESSDSCYLDVFNNFFPPIIFDKSPQGRLGRRSLRTLIATSIQEHHLSVQQGFRDSLIYNIISNEYEMKTAYPEMDFYIYSATLNLGVSWEKAFDDYNHDMQNIGYLFMVLRNTTTEKLVDLKISFKAYRHEIFKPPFITDSDLNTILKNTSKSEKYFPSMSIDESCISLLAIYLKDDEGYPSTYISSVIKPLALEYKKEGTGKTYHVKIREPNKEKGLTIRIPYGWYNQ